MVCARRREIDLESARQNRIPLAPLVHQDARDVNFVHAQEHAGIGALLHDGQRIAQHQLVGRQAAIALAFRRALDNAADRAQSAAVGHELQLDGQADEFLERQAGLRGHAQ